MNHALKILVIRRDNIGDLVCITPLFRALRQRFPDAYLGAFVNTYNSAVISRNPDINEIFSYSKAKHRTADQSLLSVYWARFLLMLKLRRMNFDYVILAAPGFQPRSLRLARMIAARHIIGFTDGSIEVSQQRAIDIAIPYSLSPMHEVEDVFRLLKPLGIEGKPPVLCVVRAASVIQRNKTQFTIGLHISARKVSQRWPSTNFCELAKILGEKYAFNLLLFWSPGDENNPLHPGDDKKAQEVISCMSDQVSLTPYPTNTLDELINGLSLCDMLICSDGGAMHVAAGLGKPILCFFGKSDTVRWRPWGVPYVLLQDETREVGRISVASVAAAFDDLYSQLGDAGPT